MPPLDPDEILKPRPTNPEILEEYRRFENRKRRQNMSGNRLRRPGYEVPEDILGYSEHGGIGRVLEDGDTAAEPILRRLTEQGESLWYRPPSDDVETTGTLAVLTEREKEALGPEGMNLYAGVEWVARDQEANDLQSALHLLTLEEYRKVRNETLSALLADIIAAGDRKDAGTANEGESVEDATGRLAAHMRNDAP